MYSLPPTIRYDVLTNMLDTSNNQTFTCLEHPLKKIVGWCTVCREWHSYFSPFLRDITQNPLLWSLKHENKTFFRYWLGRAKGWVLGAHNPKIQYIDRFIEKQRNHYKLDPVNDCWKKSDIFPFSVFSALGMYNTTEDFLKYVWLEMYKGNFFQPCLGDYYRSLVYYGDQKTIDWLASVTTKSNEDNCLMQMRKDLLANNTSSNILYHIDRYYVWSDPSTRHTMLWEPLMLSGKTDKILELKKQGLFLCGGTGCSSV